MWQKLRPQVAELLSSLSLLQEVSSVPKIKFDGYPAAHIIPSENTGDYETNVENNRTYAFTIRLFEATKPKVLEQAYEKLEKVVDAVLDLFDREDLTDDSRTVGVNLGEAYTFINIYAAPGLWTFVEEEELLVAEVTIKIRISIDVNATPES